MTRPSHRHVYTVLAGAALCACGTPVMRGAPDIDTLTATEAAARICAGTLSSEALVQAYLARARSRPELNAFVTLDEAGALRSAREADQRRATGTRCLPLQGVPIVVKDNIHARGLPSSLARSTVARRCGRQWAATLRLASRRSRIRAIRLGRWQCPWRMWNCWTAW